MWRLIVRDVRWFGAEFTPKLMLRLGFCLMLLALLAAFVPDPQFGNVVRFVISVWIGTCCAYGIWASAEGLNARFRR